MVRSKSTPSRAPRAGKRSNGFALLELLIAVVLVGVGVTSVLLSMRRNAAFMAELDSRATAIGLLKTKLVELELAAGEGTAPQSTSGSFDAPLDQFSWQVVALDRGDWSSDAGRLWEIEVGVSYPGKAKSNPSVVQVGRLLWIPSARSS